MLAVLEVTLPVFALVFCGYVAAGRRMLPEKAVEGINAFVFRFALPAMLFAAVSRGSLDRILDWPFLGGVVTATLACAAVAFGVSAWLQGGTPQDHSLRALNASFSNTGYLGIPLVTVAYGPEAALPAAMATVATNVMLFATGLTLLELFDRRHPEHGKGIALALLGTARSPLIWPIALAIVPRACGDGITSPTKLRMNPGSSAAALSALSFLTRAAACVRRSTSFGCSSAARRSANEEPPLSAASLSANVGISDTSGERGRSCQGERRCPAASSCRTRSPCRR